MTSTVIAPLAAVAKVTPAPGHTPAFGSGPWLVLVLCVVVVIAIFVAVLVSGIFRRRKYPPAMRSRRGPE